MKNFLSVILLSLTFITNAQDNNTTITGRVVDYNSKGLPFGLTNDWLGRALVFMLMVCIMPALLLQHFILLRLVRLKCCVGHREHYTARILQQAPSV